MGSRRPVNSGEYHTNQEFHDIHFRTIRALRAEEAAHLPLKLDGLYRAQTMWDAAMGWNALQPAPSNARQG